MNSVNRQLNYLVLGVAYLGLFFNFSILSLIDEYFLVSDSAYNLLFLIFIMSGLVSGILMSFFDGLLFIKRKAITTIVFIGLIFSLGKNTMAITSTELVIFQIINGVGITYLLLSSISSISIHKQDTVDFSLYHSILMIFCAIGTLITHHLLYLLDIPHYSFLILIFSYVFVGTLQLILRKIPIEGRFTQKLSLEQRSNLSLVYFITLLFAFSVTVLYLSDLFQTSGWHFILIMGLLVLSFSLQHRFLKVLKHPFQLTTVGILISALILPLTSIWFKGYQSLLALTVLGLSLSLIYYSGIYVVSNYVNNHHQLHSLGLFYCSLLGGCLGGYIAHELVTLLPIPSPLSLSLLFTGSSIFFIRRLANSPSPLKIPR